MESNTFEIISEYPRRSALFRDVHSIHFMKHDSKRLSGVYVLPGEEGGETAIFLTKGDILKINGFLLCQNDFSKLPNNITWSKTVRDRKSFKVFVAIYIADKKVALYGDRNIRKVKLKFNASTRTVEFGGSSGGD